MAILLMVLLMTYVHIAGDTHTCMLHTRKSNLSRNDSILVYSVAYIQTRLSVMVNRQLVCLRQKSVFPEKNV